MKYHVTVKVKIVLDQRTLYYSEQYITEDPDIKYVSLDTSVEIEEVIINEINEEDAETLYRLKSAYTAIGGEGNFFDVNGEEIDIEEYEILKNRF